MRITGALLGLLLLAGCMPPSQEQLRMQMDFEEMKRRLAKVEVQSADAVSSGSADGEALQRQVAELQAGLDNLRVDFQSINGRIDDLSRDNRQLADELQLVKDDMGLQLSSLGERVDQLEQRAAGQPRSSATTAPVAPAPAVETPESLYQEALDKIRKEEQYAAGRQLLERFARRYPDHDLYVNALYWSGEALYGEKKYELAILQFQDVISKHTQHSKAAAAMLKQALAFEALGDAQNAKTTMQKLLEDYPASSQAASAKKYLQQ